MKRRPLITHVLPAFVGLIAVVIIAVEWHAADRLEAVQIAGVERELASAAITMCAEMDADPGILAGDEVQRMCRRMAAATSCRYTVVLPSGQVVGDSEADPAAMENHANRPEIIDALTRGTGIQRHFSRTLNTSMMYFATVVASGGKPVAVVRTAMPLDRIEAAISEMRRRIAISGALALIVAAAIGYLISRRVTRPLTEIAKRAAAIGGGDLAGRIATSPVTELDALGRTMNDMAGQLSARIETITRQRDEENAFLSSMVEAALAVDGAKVLMRVNEAACRMFGLDAKRDLGKNIAEVIRNADLLAVVESALCGEGPVEGDVYLPDEKLHMQAHGAALRAPDGARRGAVVVLNDVTRLQRLENVRRDFVANVSHELKTPITSIVGFIDTLVDGSVKDEADRVRFLKIVQDEASRLHSIVDDLLALSAIENDERKKTIELRRGDVRQVLDNALQPLRARAEQAGLTLAVSCPAGLEMAMSPRLLEMAIMNMADNAVKYCPSGSRISISAAVEGGEVVIRVADNGPGIAAEHLPRLFERFYRVDKSRSRKMGGTGLGLAIVKHVAGVHRGRVSVESEVGKGSVFAIHLPV